MPTGWPPMTRPATEAVPSVPPQAPNAWPRSSGGKLAWMIARICGTIRPAIAPSKKRATISISRLAATPQSNEATVKPATPMTNRRLRP